MNGRNSLRETLVDRVLLGCAQSSSNGSDIRNAFRELLALQDETETVALAVAFKQCNASAELTVERNELAAKLAKLQRAKQQQRPATLLDASAAPSSSSSGAQTAGDQRQQPKNGMRNDEEGNEQQQEDANADEDEDEDADADADADEEDDDDEDDGAPLSVQDIVRMYQPSSVSDLFNTIG